MSDFDDDPMCCFPGAKPCRQEPPKFDLVQHIVRQKDFSLRTFGPGMRVEGLVAHIAKELREIEESPLDLQEYVDVILLALDGAWRAGHTPEQIAHGLLAKLEKNEQRKWPDWRTVQPGQPIEHIREG